MIKPLTNSELNRYDDALQKFLSSELKVEGEFVTAMRERLRLAEVVIDAVDEFKADDGDGTVYIWRRIDRALAAYRQAVRGSND